MSSYCETDKVIDRNDCNAQYFWGWPMLSINRRVKNNNCNFQSSLLDQMQRYSEILEVCMLLLCHRLGIHSRKLEFLKAHAFNLLKTVDLKMSGRVWPAVTVRVCREGRKAVAQSPGLHCYGGVQAIAWTYHSMHQPPRGEGSLVPSSTKLINLWRERKLGSRPTSGFNFHSLCNVEGPAKAGDSLPGRLLHTLESPDKPLHPSIATWIWGSCGCLPLFLPFNAMP